MVYHPHWCNIDVNARYFQTDCQLLNFTRNLNIWWLFSSNDDLRSFSFTNPYITCYHWKVLVSLIKSYQIKPNVSLNCHIVRKWVTLCFLSSTYQKSNMVGLSYYTFTSFFISWFLYYICDRCQAACSNLPPLLFPS